ncbi:ty3-gypsy retrotransposon protein [Cucumis melo var. makuwa]|uniref:Ty3-gypsy retrotransposon protein n=1 Tax=Cucumis melo var. makuwa TaxID=1194695 RepID=A0A5A7UC37_CUCMM|nr:ty3-gypsy retrotransposon protein [Cucumis melo var. makuwa]TYK21452.1 ty3-gypsy retrotransposon protein [Cucumis melo var. makuwa]
MMSKGNTSKALSDINKQPNTRSHSRENQSFEDMPPFEVAKNIWEQLSKPLKGGIIIKENPVINKHSLSFEMLKMTKLEKKVNMLMKVVEERDYEIASLKNHIDRHDAAELRDLLVKQFARTLKANTFDWYTDLEPETIDSWVQLEKDFLNLFYNTRRIVIMIELTATKQEKSELVIDYINRWRALSLDCKDRLTELSAVEMCTQGMHWGLLYIL